MAKNPPGGDFPPAVGYAIPGASRPFRPFRRGHRMETLSAAVLQRVLATVPKRRIGLVGDLFLDRYLDIDAGRDEPSVETGLTAYQVTGVRNYPGALGTVLNNLVALGVGTIHPVTFIGDDGEGYDLLRELRARRGSSSGVVVDDVIVSRDRMTPTYTKPMYGSAGGVRELNRLDTKNRTPTPVTTFRCLGKIRRGDRSRSGQRGRVRGGHGTAAGADGGTGGRHAG
jgi:hypothetical protein